MASDVFTIPLPVQDPTRVPQTDRDLPARWKPGEFVGDQANALCRVAAASILHEPPRFNPLVLHGPPGLGKSLLARGLAQCWRQHNKGAKAIILGGADFAREYANAVEADSLSDFRTRYRRAALLAIDDLQEVGQKPSVQSELVRTIDGLLIRGGRLIATLPLAPVECSTLLAGLASRLSSGLVIPMAAPGPAARRKILRLLCAAYHLRLSEAAVEWLAGGPTENAAAPTTVPELDEFLQHLAEVSGQLGRPLDAELVRQAWGSRRLVPKTPLRSITRLVCRYFRLKSTDLKGPTRQQRVVRARGVAMLLARQLTGESLEQVGRHFGNRDHTTVLHACRKTESLIASDPAIRQANTELTLQLASS